MFNDCFKLEFWRDEILVQLFPFFQSFRKDPGDRVQPSTNAAKRGNTTFLIASADKICPNYRHLINNKFIRINLIVSTSRTRVAFVQVRDLQQERQMSLLNSTASDSSHFY